MKIGLQVSSFTWPKGPAGIGATLGAIARAGDEAGFHSLWLMDHYFQIPGVGPPEHDMLEGYSGLSYCAALTERIKLGTMATGVTYRHPGLLVKTVTTLDVLSGGRACLGVGAAWFELEHRGLGVPFPPLRVRFEQLEETLQIAKQMWSGDEGPYRGEHFTLERTLCRPQPLSRPHPPILVAGGGETKTLRLVAKYGDACNVFGDIPTIRHKFDVLKRRCDEVGRDYAEIEKTSLGSFRLAPDKPAELIAHLRELAAAGVQHAIFSPPAEDPAALERLREVVAEAAAF